MTTLVQKTLRPIFPILALLLAGCRPNNSPPTLKPAPLTASRFTGITEIQLSPNPWIPVYTNQPVQPGSELRTGTNSFLELTSTSNWQRVLLVEQSEAAIERWKDSSQNAGRDEAKINLRHGLLMIDLPAASITAASIFDVNGSNFTASVRSGGTVAAITADGFVLLQTGTIVCTWISPPAPPTAVTLNPGQMFDPTTQTAKPIPASSNQVWNPLFN